MTDSKFQNYILEASQPINQSTNQMNQINQMNQLNGQKQTKQMNKINQTKQSNQSNCSNQSNHNKSKQSIYLSIIHRSITEGLIRETQGDVHVLTPPRKP